METEIVDIKECKEKHIWGFIGSRYYEGVYAGKNYAVNPRGERMIALFSREPITSRSMVYRNGYETLVRVDELDDLYRCKMYATYKGHEYEVEDVGPELEDLYLRARRNPHRNLLKEDEELGFIYYFEERMAGKFVTPEELDSIRVEKESVKERFSHSQAYNDFIRQTKAQGSGRLDGFSEELFQNIFEDERGEVEDIIWNRFVNEKDSDVALYMPELQRYDGLKALRDALKTFRCPSDAYFSIAEALYKATQQKRYLRAMLLNAYLEKSRSRLGYVSQLEKYAMNHLVYVFLVYIYLFDGYDVTRHTAMTGIFFADGLIEDFDDHKELKKKRKLFRMIKDEQLSNRVQFLIKYKLGKIKNNTEEGDTYND